MDTIKVLHIHAYPKRKISKRKVFLISFLVYGAYKTVQELDRRVTKLEKRIEELEKAANDDKSDLDKDILEEDFLK